MATAGEAARRRLSAVDVFIEDLKLYYYLPIIFSAIICYSANCSNLAPETTYQVGVGKKYSI